MSDPPFSMSPAGRSPPPTAPAAAPPAGARWVDPPRRRARSQRFLVVAAFVMALLVPLIAELGQRSAANLDEARKASAQSRQAIATLRSELLAMESGKRGYILTGRREYRQPFEANRHNVDASVRAVEGLADPQRPDGAAMAAIAKEAMLKFSEMREVMRLWDSGARNAAMDLMLTDIGRTQMERIETLAAQAKRENDAALERAVIDNVRIVRLSRAAVALLAVLFVVVSWRALQLARRGERERGEFVEQLARERDHLDEQVRTRTVELTELARHLQTAREHERTRLARQLHDELGGVLTAAKLDATRMRQRLAGAEPALRERLQHLTQMLDHGIAVKRRIIDDLHPATLESLGLVRALQGLADAFVANLPLRLERDLHDVALDADAALVAYRVVQEALDNVLRHADAHVVSLSLRSEGRDAVVTVADDGRGFEPGPDDGGLGLDSLRFRVQSCGGVLTVQSRPGAGTTVRARLPLAEGAKTAPGASAPAA